MVACSGASRPFRDTVQGLRGCLSVSYLRSVCVTCTIKDWRLARLHLRLFLPLLHVNLMVLPYKKPLARGVSRLLVSARHTNTPGVLPLPTAPPPYLRLDRSNHDHPVTAYYCTMPTNHLAARRGPPLQFQGWGSLIYLPKATRLHNLVHSLPEGGDAKRERIGLIYHKKWP